MPLASDPSTTNWNISETALSLSRACNICGLVFTKDEFPPRHRFCKWCNNRKKRRHSHKYVEYRRQYNIRFREKNKKSCSDRYRRVKGTIDLVKANAATKRWGKNFPEKLLAKWQRRRARQLGAEGSYTADQWTRLKAFYGNVCLCCGVHESVTKLTVDHVIPLAKGGSHYITNIQPLCMKCNAAKNTKDTDYRQVCLLEYVA
jgi:hypothetical protein